jgi:hypothetical protein
MPGAGAQPVKGRREAVHQRSYPVFTVRFDNSLLFRPFYGEAQPGALARASLLAACLLPHLRTGTREEPAFVRHRWRDCLPVR